MLHIYRKEKQPEWMALSGKMCAARRPEIKLKGLENVLYKHTQIGIFEKELGQRELHFVDNISRINVVSDDKT